MEQKTNIIEIVIVIENKIQGSFLESIFNPDSFSVNKFFNGREAYEYLINNAHLDAVIIMSYQLPEMDGLQVMKAVKEQGKEFAYIFMTSDKTVERAVEAMKAGANDFIPKSNHLEEELVPMVKKVFQLQQIKLEQERIKKELAKLSIVARETNNAIAMFDDKGELEWINEGFTRLTGYTKQEFIEIFGSNILDASHSVEINDVVKTCIDTKKPVNYSYQSKTKSNETIWVQTTLTPIVDEHGDITRLVTIDSDITEMKLAEQEILRQKENITNSILYAQRIQKALLPPEEFMNHVLVEHFILFKPRDIVSGDFFWLSQKENKLIITAADCTGHGVPGAFMSMLGMSGLNEIVHLDANTSSSNIQANQILNKLRQYIIRSLRQTKKSGEATDGMDISLCIIDFENKHIQYAGANNALYLVRNEQLITYEADKMPIGIHKRATESFTNNNIEIEGNDMLYIFSDGYMDQFGGTENRKFMSKYFKELLLDIHNLPVEDQKHILEQKHNEWKGENSQTDDILVIGFRCVITDNDENLNIDSINWKGKKILIVDDDEYCAMLLEEMLFSTEIEVIKAGNGKEAVELVKNTTGIDIILMDIQMPIMDGNEATANIKAVNPNIKIIIQTAYTMGGEKEKSFKSGCDDYIAKPIDRRKLICKLNKILSKK